MNPFDARVEERGGDRWVVSEAFELRLPPNLAAELDGWDGNPDDVEFGIRPEHVFDAGVRGDPGRVSGSTCA